MGAQHRALLLLRRPRQQLKVPYLLCHLRRRVALPRRVMAQATPPPTTGQRRRQYPAVNDQEGDANSDATEKQPTDDSSEPDDSADHYGNDAVVNTEFTRDGRRGNANPRRYNEPTPSTTAGARSGNGACVVASIRGSVRPCAVALRGRGELCGEPRRVCRAQRGPLAIAQDVSQYVSVGLLSAIMNHSLAGHHDLHAGAADDANTAKVGFAA